MSYQDSMDSQICVCGIKSGTCMGNCPHFTNFQEFDPNKVGMLELYDKVDALTAKYHTLQAGPNRNKFRKEVSKIVAIANERSLKQNKIVVIKTNWWL